MKKHLRKQFLRILIKLLIAAIIILLLIFLFGFLDDLMNKLDILIKKSHIQAGQIELLEQEIHSLEVQNAHLENVVTYQHEQLQELKVSGNTMTFTMQPKEMTVEDVHKEIKPQLHNQDLINTSTITATVLGIFSIIRGTIGSLVIQ